MTPLEIRLLLHIHTTPRLYENPRAPAVKKAIDGFIDDGLMTASPQCDQDSHPFTLTPRGRAMVEHLCETPLPVAYWDRLRRRCPGDGDCERAGCNAHNSCDRI